MYELLAMIYACKFLHMPKLFKTKMCNIDGRMRVEGVIGNSHERAMA